MTKRCKSREVSRKIDTGGGAYVEGDINSEGGEIILRDKIVYGEGADSITKAFSALYKALQEVPDGPKKAMASQAVTGLEEEARKGQAASENTVKEWFESLMMMLPDIGEVAIRTFVNPIDGVSTVFQKIAQKAKESKEANA